MGNIRKGIQRKREIIETAFNLFVQNGYERTSVQQIIDTLGISKGTFYHHFKSKDDLLDAVISDILEDVASEINRIANSDKDAVTKLIEIYGVFRGKEDALKLILAELYRDTNLKMRQKFLDQMLKITSPPLNKVLEQGKDEGAFDIVEVKGIARLLIVMDMAVGEAIFGLMKERDIKGIKSMLDAYAFAIKRILGTDADIKFTDVDVLKLIENI